MNPWRLLLIPELLLLCRLAGAAGRFAADWLYSRRFGRLVLATPAIVLGVTFCLSILLSRTESRNKELLTRYLDLARQASQQNDIPAMHLHFRRAQLLSHNRPEVTFEYAVSIFQAGLASEAFQMMSGLAPTNKTGYLPAHRFLAENVTIDDPAKADLFRAVHLGHVIRADVNSRVERLRLLEIFARYRRFDRADALLRQTLDQHHEDRLTLARMKAKSGNISDAREEANRACEQLQLDVDRSPDDTARRIQLAQGHVFLGRFPEALTSLIEGFEYGDSPILVDAVSRTYELWYSVLDVNQQKSHSHQAIAG